MKISCEIIKDLLPLYHDGVCSKESNEMVEEHLSDCENCKAELLAMDHELIPNNHIEENIKEAEAVKKLSKEWKKGMIVSLFQGILITLIVFLILYCFIGIQVVSTGS